MSESTLDTPLHRATIDMMPVDDLDIMLLAIRERRLTVVNKLEAVAAQKKDANDAKLVAKYEKLFIKLKGKIEKLDATIADIEIDTNKLRAIALELEG